MYRLGCTHVGQPLTVEQLLGATPRWGSMVTDIGARFDGDQLGDDPVRAWDSAVKSPLASFGVPGALDGTVALSAGPKADAGVLLRDDDRRVDPLVGSRPATGADESLDAGGPHPDRRRPDRSSHDRATHPRNADHRDMPGLVATVRRAGIPALRA